MKSEFIANQELELHIKDKQPSPSVKGAELVIIKKGEPIPKFSFLHSYGRTETL